MEIQTQSLKVALVGPLPPPSGGMANQTRQLADLLKQEGVSVELVQINAPYAPHWVGYITGLRALFRLLPYLFNLWRAAGRNDLFHVMANSGWSWHLFAAPALWIAKLRGIPVVLNYRGGEADEFFSQAIFWVNKSLKFASVIVVPSVFLEQVFAKHGYATSIVPNIINLDRFQPNIEASLNNPHILVARNLEPLYDNATALRAFAIIRSKYPTAQMTVAGTGFELDALMQLAHELGLADAVSFVGRVENSDMPTLYQTAHIALNPSLADNMPISILEALASGVAVVSTNVGGVPFLVEDGKTALLVHPGSPEQMAKAVIRVLQDESKRVSMVKAGLEAVQKFAWKNVRPLLLSVYEAARNQSTQAHKIK